MLVACKKTPMAIRLMISMVLGMIAGMVIGEPLLKNEILGMLFLNTLKREKKNEIKVK